VIEADTSLTDAEKDYLIVKFNQAIIELRTMGTPAHAYYVGLNDYHEWKDKTPYKSST
jgi:hypothetical protein